MFLTTSPASITAVCDLGLFLTLCYLLAQQCSSAKLYTRHPQLLKPSTNDDDDATAQCSPKNECPHITTMHTDTTDSLKPRLASTKQTDEIQNPPPSPSPSPPSSSSSSSSSAPSAAGPLNSIRIASWCRSSLLSLLTFTRSDRVLERVLALLRPPPPHAPRRSVRKTLVLDLDETLIHSSRVSSHALPHDFIIDCGTVSDSLYHIYKRPHVDYFLETMKKLNYRLVIFTAGLQEYADPILDHLDPSGSLLDLRLYRGSCEIQGSDFVKNLRNVGADPRDVMILDNTPAAYRLDPENAIPIDSWTRIQVVDECLLELIPFLKAMVEVEDVRSVLALRTI